MFRILRLHSRLLVPHGADPSKAQSVAPGQTNFAGDFTGFVKAYTPIIDYAMCTPVRAAVITGPSVTFQLQAKHYKDEKHKQRASWYDVHINLPSNWSHPTNFDLVLVPIKHKAKYVFRCRAVVVTYIGNDPCIDDSLNRENAWSDESAEFDPMDCATSNGGADDGDDSD